MSDKPRILVVSHGHPDKEPGGGELAARSLHQALNSSDKFDSVFMARSDDPFPAHEGCAFSGTQDTSEVLFYSSTKDRFLFKQTNPVRAAAHFRDALEIIKPDIVHFHHYLHLGLELFGEVRRYNPLTTIIVTLHDYQAICNNNGQMIKTGSQALCKASSSIDCQQCFPSRRVQDFMLRERHIKNWFSLVDAFVSPSEFLASRYIQWGIDAARIHCIENLLSTDANAEKAQSVTRYRGTDGGLKTRFAFFGRINSVKGIDVLLQAALQLPADIRQKIQIDVHGTGLDRQAIVSQLKIKLLAKRLAKVVRLCGSYQQAELPTLMQNADWMIMPSRWWENSPVVILEARKHALPVICANIGGMAEKIADNETGLHFRAGDPHSLAEQLIKAVNLGDKQTSFSQNILATSDQANTLQQHLQLHQKLLKNKQKKVHYTEQLHVVK